MTLMNKENEKKGETVFSTKLGQLALGIRRFVRKSKEVSPASTE